MNLDSVIKNCSQELWFNTSTNCNFNQKTFSGKIIRKYLRLQNKWLFRRSFLTQHATEFDDKLSYSMNAMLEVPTNNRKLYDISSGTLRIF